MIAAFFAVFLVFPVGHVLAGAFVVDGKFSFEAFTLAFQNPVLVESIQNSFAVSGIVMVACTVLAFPLALLFVNREFRGKGVFQALLLGALVLPPFVASIGFRQLFARFGSVNLALLELGWIDRPIDFLGAHPLAGVIALETLHLFPILFLNLLATLANVDPSLVEAAASSGASRWRVFRKVTFPLVLPGWFAGAIVVFIFALTDLGTPIVFDARNLVAVQIFERASEGSREPVAYALVVMVLVLTLVLFGLGRYAVARHSGAQASKGTVASRTRPLSRGEALWVVPLLILLVVATLLPHLSILLVSISDHWFFSALPQEVTARHYGRLATDPIAYLGVKNSLIYASLSTLVDLVLGVAIAWLSVRKRTKTGFLLDAMAMLPLALPGIVLAFGYANGFTSPMLDGLPAPVRAFFASPTVLLVFGYAVRR
ncbi:MAG: iron ABC transporter permease, partial [Planctomycetes bacterium]|nr:iron ABC transporter permease [Planctomycetota bacterium]